MCQFQTKHKHAEASGNEKVRQTKKISVFLSMRWLQVKLILKAKCKKKKIVLVKARQISVLL